MKIKIEIEGSVFKMDASSRDGHFVSMIDTEAGISAPLGYASSMDKQCTEMLRELLTDVAKVIVEAQCR